ncbi:phage baseplate assembly protein V [Pseudomonas alloputida]|uniref:phage baseplate assembly protein V n=1 Tax=Pseudomonas alloputida TaxID=1940621 RepID=UPI001E3EED39|nr:phage baseplate assembly protein V [Pseudomonas alloputida]MCE0890598.1 phage baseplate assembly protein V [Pseudomonas alloputida]MCE0919860.1 phage baseplate assembly protein V [Pseudomonas alloputida]MCE1046181.1 phage baseplate assembly protein V [Pseudomonas alloputida]MCE1092721.1 phage baseplate assembly protein V [Pseudomonas alloputida]MCE1126465.1 phage baseplate assembly protein V [Pseudomonas alloputida]
MNSIAELNRLLENLVRLGTIAEVQHAPPRVQVRTGGILTTWLPWLALRAGADREWDPPTVDEQVILLSPSGQLANGIAITGLFSDQIPANGDRAGLKRRTYAHGAVVEYDSVAHHLRAILPSGGTSEVISDGGIRIVGDIVHEGNYTQTGNQKVTGKVEVSIDVIAAGISLVEHVHGGVMPGPGKTGSPVK